ncbi:hypothetical protein FRC10_007933 [Ceratobasidium sp. 414]|nr:hypothetical protein FRC10_007933 [Ceratobasidium sp. 414]
MSLTTFSVKIAKTVYQIDAALQRVLPYTAHIQFLQNLTSFSLCGGYFDWDSAAFVGLEHLWLVWVAYPGPTLAEIVRMLRASPRLRTLCLAGVPISQEEKTDHPPVHLEYLQRLSLLSLGERDLCALVPLLHPGPKPLTLHLKGDLETGLLSKLFQRSNIEAMYLHSQITRQTMSDIFPTLPHLGCLYCSYNNIGNVLETLSAPLPNGNPKTPSLLPCPQLRTLYFHKCAYEATNTAPEGPVTNQPTLVIKLQNCAIPHPAKFPQSELASEVLFEHECSGMPTELAFDGVDHACVYGLYSDRELEGPNVVNLQLLGAGA